MKLRNLILLLLFIFVISCEMTSTGEKGSLTVWSNSDQGGQLVIYVDDVYVGTLTQYQTGQTTVECDEAGTFSMELEAGSHIIKAEDNQYNYSEDNITIRSGQCYVYLFDRL